MANKCPKCEFVNTADSKFCKECGTQLIPLADAKLSFTETLEVPKEELTTGSTFAGRYQIIEELGKGGMGKVYRALDKELNEEVALKLIKPEVSSDKKTIERFKNELRLARKISHKNVGRMYELMEKEGIRFISMEYVPGEDLKSSIRRFGQLPIGKSIDIAKQVCEGLTEAHELGVVHRDLKPSNIMIDKKGNAKIMDFGIARSLEAKGITGAGMMIGTPEYMSPEQVEGKEVDPRSDIYSLGVILFEMVTGRVPFEGYTALTIAVKHKSEVPKNPQEYNAQISGDLSRVILRCLEKDREKRYQYAEELRSELANIEKGIPTTERTVPAEKPLTSKKITFTFGFKKLLIPTLIVVAILVFGLLIWNPWEHKESVPILSDKPSVAVMYFKNNTGDENLDFWRGALSDSIITDLSQSKHIRVLSIDQLYSILDELNLLEARNYTTEDLKTTAAKGGVNHILQGSLSKAGGNFRIEYTLQNINTGEILSSERMQGVGEASIFTMVDELTIRIKKNFNLSRDQMSSDIDKDVRHITTGSPEALRYYSEGLKYKWKGEIPKSIPFLEKATALDPEFAMAYRYLAYGIPEKRRMYMQKAFELSDRISDRERYQIQGDYYALSEKTYQQAIDSYENLLQLYPDDLRGSVSLGNIYGGLEQWDKAVELYELGIENKVESFVPYVNLANVYAALGLYDKSLALLKSYLKSFPDNKWIHYFLFDMYMIQRKYTLALSEVERAFSLDPAYYDNIRMRGDVYLFKGDLSKAELEYQKMQDLDEKAAHLSSRSRLTWLYLLQAKFDESMDQIRRRIELAKGAREKGWEYSCYLDLAYLNIRNRNAERALEECNKSILIAVEIESTRNQIRGMYFKGLAYLELGLIDEAQRTANELKKVIEGWYGQKLIRYYHNLMGMIELKREKFFGAIGYFEKAISLLPYQNNVARDDVLFIDPLALAFYKSGDLDKAREAYERMVSLTIGRLNWADIYAKSFYNLGIINEQKGWKSKAIEHYEKFLDLWKDADPGIAEVEDAKNRLAGLKAN